MVRHANILVVRDTRIFGAALDVRTTLVEHGSAHLHHRIIIVAAAILADVAILSEHVPVPFVDLALLQAESFV